MVSFKIDVLIEADDPKEAYTALYDWLAHPESPMRKWMSHTYSIDDGEERDTEELW